MFMMLVVSATAMWLGAGVDLLGAGVAAAS